jgi:hypothetical protein
MGWERRQRGGVYFYRSVRIDGQPRKVYLGTGPAAERQASLESEKRQRHQSEREALLAEQVQVAGADRALEDLRFFTDLLARATLILAGLHEHRGEWRRRRNESTTQASQ